MDQQQNAAAGNEAVSHIEHRELDKIGLDHVHYVTKAEAVNHIADAAAVDGYDQPALKIGKGPALAGKLPDDGGGEQDKYDYKQPLGTLKGGEGGAGIAHVGQAQQAGNEVHMAVQGDVLKHQKLGKLVSGYNACRKECHP